MAAVDGEDLKRSPLHQQHQALGARLVPFGGWDMPLSYPEGTVAEHRACRNAAVAFDVSHLGTVRVTGPDAFARLQGTLTNDLTRIGPGRAQYTHLLDEDGFVLDDIIVWWVDDERFDVMPNASNTTSVRGAIGGTDVTAERAVIAVQGPDARTHLGKVAPEAAAVPRFAVTSFTYGGVQCLAAGTGYTGEDGVECAVPAEQAPAFWDEVLATGVQPAGLGARDTLRLEAGLPLHGHELGPGITPLQAGLGWVVRFDKGPFPGRAALLEERAAGPARLLHGLVTDTRQPPRGGATVAAGGPGGGGPGGRGQVGGRPVGVVTSGNFSPMLGVGIALAFIDTAAGLAVGDVVDIDVRGKALPATIARTPFWPPPEVSATPDTPADGGEG